MERRGVIRAALNEDLLHAPSVLPVHPLEWGPPRADPARRDLSRLSSVSGQIVRAWLNIKGGVTRASGGGEPSGRDCVAVPAARAIRGAFLAGCDWASFRGGHAFRQGVAD